MQDDKVLAFAERFVSAIERGDVEEVRACYAPDAVIWHNNDGVEQTVEQNIKVLGWFMRKLPSRAYRIVRREALPDGFLQQHVVEGALADGRAFSMPACIIIRMRDGLIIRLDEYLDPAQAAALSEARA